MTRPEVGVNYFMTGLDFVSTTFLSRYHLPGVRATVQSQLAALAAAGTLICRTPIWFASLTPATPPDWFISFPPSGQELNNIIQVGADVRATGMRWEVSFGWQGCADLGPAVVPCGLTEEQQYVRIEQTLDAVMGLFSSAFRPERVYLFIEVSMAFVRMPTFLTRMWPRFRTLCAPAGIIPSLYGHSAAPMVAVLAFMTAQGLVLPDRAEMSLYLTTAPPLPTQAQVTAEINVLRTAGIARIGIAETYYPVDPVERSAWGAAFAQVPAIEALMVWPSVPSPAYTAMPPYDLAPYGQPAGTVTTTGAPVAGQVAVFSGETALAGYTGLTYTPATNALTLGGGRVPLRKDPTLVYGPTISAPDVALGDWFLVNITDTAAHTLAAPVNGYDGAEIRLMFLTTVGAIATCVFNAAYRQAGYVKPGAGFYTAAPFRCRGGVWYQMSPWAVCAL
jgi:hypothetical protein